MRNTGIGLLVAAILLAAGCGTASVKSKPLSLAAVLKQKNLELEKIDRIIIKGSEADFGADTRAEITDAKLLAAVRDSIDGAGFTNVWAMSGYRALELHAGEGTPITLYVNETDAVHVGSNEEARYHCPGLEAFLMKILRYAHSGGTFRPAWEPLPYTSVPLFPWSRAETETYDWGVLYYMPYDNNLDPAALDIINAVRKGSTAPNILTAVQADYLGEGGMQRYLINHRGIFHQPILSDNSADPRQLHRFVRWFTSRYRCRRLIVIILGHGRGVAEMCTDKHRIRISNESMTADAAGRLLRVTAADLKPEWELLFLQQCGRASLAGLYAFRGTARFIMASPLRIGSPNTYYAAWHKWLAAHPDASGAEAAASIAREDRDFQIYTCIRGGALKNLPRIMARVYRDPPAGLRAVLKQSERIYRSSDGTEFVDAVGFCERLNRPSEDQEVRSETAAVWLETALVQHVWRHREAAAKTVSLSGLSIFIPRKAEEIEKCRTLELYQQTGWAEFWEKALRPEKTGDN